jgi:Fungal Zn(2)-Cys(6) binuclear cluster domain
LNIHRSKIKCHGERPNCSSCSKRKVSCIYEILKERNVSNCREPLSPPYLHQSMQQASRPVSIDSNALSQGQDFPTTSTSLGVNVSLEASNLFDSLLDIEPDWSLDWTFNNERFDHEVLNNNLFYPRGEAFSNQIRFTAQYSSHAPGYQSFADMLSKCHSPSGSGIEETYVPVDPWPMAWHSTPVHISALPPLRITEHENLNRARYFTIPSITSATVSNLKEFLLQSGSTPWQPVSLDEFPNQEQIDHCIDLYFKHCRWVSQPTAIRSRSSGPKA